MLNSFGNFSRIKRQQPNKWTTNQRIALAFLVCSYKNSWEDLWAVFNHYFADELPTRLGLNAHTLRTQWWQVSKEFDVDTAMKEMPSWQCSPSLNTSGLVTQDLLEEKAYAIGIRLVRRDVNAVPELSIASRTSKPVNRKRAARHQADEISSSDPATDFFLKESPVKERFRHEYFTPKQHKSTEKNLPTPPATRESKESPINMQSLQFASPQPEVEIISPESGKRLGRWTKAFARLSPSYGVSRAPIAPLGFRAFSDDSYVKFDHRAGFRAGLFTDTSQVVPPCLDVLSLEYLDHATRHVSKEWKGLTPFISVTKNPMRAIHLALKAHRSGSGSVGIAIIDFYEILRKKGSVQRAKDLNLSPGCRYNASGEYLVWGNIEIDAIVSKVPVSKILSANQDNGGSLRMNLLGNGYLSAARGVIEMESRQSPLSYKLGKEIGDFVQKLFPGRDMDINGISGLIVHSIIFDWKFQNHWKIWRSNSAFVNGLQKGYRDSFDDDNIVNKGAGELHDESVKIPALPKNDSDFDSFCAQMQNIAETSSEGYQGTEMEKPDTVQLKNAYKVPIRERDWNVELQKSNAVEEYLYHWTGM